MRQSQPKRIVMFNWLYEWWTYSAYDEDGMLKLLRGRASDPGAFKGVNATRDDIQRTLTIICESFDIDLAQRFALRPDDNLGDIYLAMTKYRICDDLEYERLVIALEEFVGEFETAELTTDINITVEEVLIFVSQRRAKGPAA